MCSGFGKVTYAQIKLYFRLPKHKLFSYFSVVENEDLKINCYVVNRTAAPFDMNDIVVRFERIKPSTFIQLSFMKLWPIVTVCFCNLTKRPIAAGFI